MNFFESIERAIDTAQARSFKQLKDGHNSDTGLPKTFQTRRSMRFLNGEEPKPKKARTNGKNGGMKK